MVQSYSDGNLSAPTTANDETDVPTLDVCKRIAKRMSSSVLESYYGEEARRKRAKLAEANPLDYLLKLALSPALQRIIVKSLDHRFHEYGTTDMHVSQDYHSLLEVDTQVQIAFQTFAHDFPTAIWTCCAKRCFARIAILTEHSGVFNAVLKIHNKAEALHQRIEGTGELIQSRRRSSGKSSLSHPAKAPRQTGNRSVTDRQRVRNDLKNLIRRSLPYLRAQSVAPDGTPPSAKPFCIQAICQILGIQRNTLYKPVPSSNCLIDDAGVRQRKFRRVGSRKGFREIPELPGYECGCDMPCFSDLDVDVLQRLWNGFKGIAGQLSPEEKEHRYLMNQMFCPLTNTSVRVCNKAVGQLYTISESLVAAIRLIVHQLCEDPSIHELPPRKHGMKRYREKHHPLNRFSEETIEHVERHLDMVLRPDPAAADGTNTCRVYSPEVNTQEKLRKLIAREIQRDTDEIQISPTSLQRMINSYLEKRDCCISFTQADHNACPTCKSYHCEILFLYYEKKHLSEKLTTYRQLPRPMTYDTQALYTEHAVPLFKELAIKEYREEQAIYELQLHNHRDARIRGWLKQFTDHLREGENKARQKSIIAGERDSFGWCQRRNFALVTHQDDMTKVDLPHVVVDASADITRWRFDVNAHVNAVTGDCVVFSHEQGAGSKNASSILEMILLDHILTCRGENIKVVVSDNASVGKNWISTVAFPQYLVDQGLAEIVLIVFLENNHGKWLADMLFGQFQIRKRNSTILGIDGLLQEFESIKRPNNGRIRGYAVNPLGCVDLAEVFAGLGYETKPPKEFGFKNRDVHFAAACRQGAKERLSPTLQKLLSNALPTAAGMVRLCSEPPNNRPNPWRRFEDRWIDVPAASRKQISSSFESTVREAPLAIPLDKEFSAKGPGVVSKRTAEHVGFNGLSFRGKMSFPELDGKRYICTREAWPPGLLQAGNPGYESESLRCAPENWILRRPVRHFGDGERNLKARYPPRNILNALFLHGPRAEGVTVEPDELVRWIPTATYEEPPFPFERQLSATEALMSLAEEHTDINQSFNLLEVLRAIYAKMGDRDSVSDSWLQRPAKIAPSSAYQEYEEILRVLQKRDGVRPRPSITIWQAFREDTTVQTEIEAEMNRMTDDVDTRTRQEVIESLFEAKMKHPSGQHSSTFHQNVEGYNAAIKSFSEQASTTRAVERVFREREKRMRQQKAKTMSKLFERWKLKPGALDRIHRLVEQDKQRFAEELKIYKEELCPRFDREHELAAMEGPIESHSV